MLFVGITRVNFLPSLAMSNICAPKYVPATRSILRFAHHDDIRGSWEVLLDALFALQLRRADLHRRRERVTASQRVIELATRSSGVTVCVTAGAFGTGSLRVVEERTPRREEQKATSSGQQHSRG